MGGDIGLENLNGMTRATSLFNGDVTRGAQECTDDKGMFTLMNYDI